MDQFRALLACPRCTGALATDWSCDRCGARFEAPDGIPALRLPCDPRTDAVRQFYERAPFPGYPQRDSIQALRARAARSPLPELIDRAIPCEARIVEVGCGTGQMSLFLARAHRLVIGADVARRPLQLGAAAARQFGLDRVQFVETDLQHPGLCANAFDVVISSGVLHHTPDPRASFAHLARLARPGGLIVLGVYNAFARLPARLRRCAARLSRFRFVPFDTVLRQRHDDAARRDAWLRDQYQHPEEHSHTLGEVQRWFAENDVEYLRTYPGTMLDEEPDLFAPAADNWALEGWIAQLEWIWTLGREGGLFFTIGRRAPRAGEGRSCRSIEPDASVAPGPH